MLSQFARFIAAKVTTDVSTYIDPRVADGGSRTITGQIMNTAQEIKAVARGETSPKTNRARIDNQTETLPSAQQRLEFAFGERLALEVAYRPLSQQQMIIPLLEEDNVIRQYRIIALHSGHGGIAGNILLPQSNTDHRRLYVNFRGTDTQNAASIHVDLEHCIGEESFHKHFAQIMGQINDLIGEVAAGSEAPVELIISGHSMGSALSQYCLNAAMLCCAQGLHNDLKREGVDKSTQELITDCHANFADYLRKQYNLTDKSLMPANYPHFAKLSTFKLNSWGTVGVSHTMAALSDLLGNLLVSNGKTVIGRFGNNKLDIVTKNGYANCLADSNGDVAYLLIEDKQLELNRSAIAGLLTGATSALLIGGLPGLVVGGATLAYHGLRPICLAHGNQHFGAYGELLTDKSYEFINNTTPEGQRAIRKIAYDKSTLLQKPIFHQAKALLKLTGDAGSKLKEKATLSAVAAIQTYDRITNKPRS